MSVERRGSRWRVRWHEGTHQRSQVFDRKSDADLFDAEIRRRKQLGTMSGFLGGKQTLDEFVTTSWGPRAQARLAASTWTGYSDLYRGIISPKIGGVRLSDLSAEVIGHWQVASLVSHAPGPVAHAQILLGTILQDAFEGGRIPRNPVRQVPLPRVQHRERPPTPGPETIEKMRYAALMTGRSPFLGQRDSLLISLLAYAGLRPEEARGLRWGDVRGSALYIQRVLVAAGFEDTKTRAHRSVRLLKPLIDDLQSMKVFLGREPRPDEQVITSENAGQFSRFAYQSWVSRSFKRFREAANAGPIVPYDLRHAFASLLLHEGRSVIYVASQLGHDARMTLQVYGHLIAELEDQPGVSAEAAISHARLLVWGTS